MSKNFISLFALINGVHKYIDMALRYNEARVISDDTLKTFAGHKDISTTQKCYIHQTKDITEYAEEFAKVLDS